MSNSPYDQLKQTVTQILTGSGMPLRSANVELVAKGAGCNAETIERLVADLCPTPASASVSLPLPVIIPSTIQPAQNETEPQEAAPFLLIELGEDLQPGAHLAPELHLLFPNYDGDARVEATIHGALDREGWSPNPELIRDADGYWIFHQILRLTVERAPCPVGNYRLEFDCQFAGSPTQHDSQWRGWLRFRVVEQGGMGQTALEIEADGQGLINLHGLDLKRFSRVKVKTGDNALVNMQSFLSELEKETSARPPDSAKPSMIPVKLRSVEDRVGVRVIAPPNEGARFDLPEGGRRVLLLPKDSVILGRNRPGSHDADHTDIVLRMHPRTEFHDSITRNISRQQLSISVAAGKITLLEPRRKESQELFPARINGTPFRETVTLPHSARPHSYITSFGEKLSNADRPPQLGLTLRSWSEPQMSHIIHQLLRKKFPLEYFPDQDPWLRGSAGLDAVLIEREGNPDDLNGKEAYLLVLGIVLIGSSPRCALRLTGPGVRPEHAVLCHWDGQFRVMAIEDAPVSCHGRPLPRGACATLYMGGQLKLADLPLTLDVPLQFGME